MKKAIKKKWLKGLRSGEYKQARYELKTKHGFCCLGVLCDLVEPKGWLRERHAGSGTYLHEIKMNDDERVMERFGFNASVVNTLVHMNDREGQTFAEIADYIEKHL